MPSPLVKLLLSPEPRPGLLPPPSASCSRLLAAALPSSRTPSGATPAPGADLRLCLACAHGQPRLLGHPRQWPTTASANSPAYSQMFQRSRTRFAPCPPGPSQRVCPRGKIPLGARCCPHFLRACQAGSPARLPGGCWAGHTHRALHTSLAGYRKYDYLRDTYYVYK